MNKPKRPSLSDLMDETRLQTIALITDDARDAAAADFAGYAPRDHFEADLVEQILMLRAVLRDTCYQAVAPNVLLPLIMRLHRTILGLQREIRHAMTALDRRQRKPLSEIAGDRAEDRDGGAHAQPGSHPAAPVETAQPPVGAAVAAADAAPDTSASRPLQSSAATADSAPSLVGQPASRASCASAAPPQFAPPTDAAPGLTCDSPMGGTVADGALRDRRGDGRLGLSPRPGRPSPAVAPDAASPAGQMEDIRAAA